MHFRISSALSILVISLSSFACAKPSAAVYGPQSAENATSAGGITVKEQAKIYLITGYDLANGLSGKMDKFQFMACRNTEALLLINKAFESDVNLANAAHEIDPIIARLLPQTNEMLSALAELCKVDGISDAEKPAASKIAYDIRMIMGQE